MARPKKEVDFKLLDSLCAIQCTGEEIAAIIGVNYDTLNSHIKEECGIGFSDYFKKKSASGKASLRRKQWALADTNPAMAIFLGKNYLGQADKREVEETRTVKVIMLEEVRQTFIQMRRKNEIEAITIDMDAAFNNALAIAEDIEAIEVE
jgi:hypothetical protein